MAQKPCTTSAIPVRRSTGGSQSPRTPTQEYVCSHTPQILPPKDSMSTTIAQPQVDDKLADVKRRLLSTECPVCLQSFAASVYQCANGHLLCHECVEAIGEPRCPTCRMRGVFSRNRVLEELLNDLRGRESVALAEDAHPESTAVCPFTEACTWTGSLCNVLAHFHTNTGASHNSLDHATRVGVGRACEMRCLIPEDFYDPLLAPRVNVNTKVLELMPTDALQLPGGVNFTPPGITTRDATYNARVRFAVSQRQQQQQQQLSLTGGTDQHHVPIVLASHNVVFVHRFLAIGCMHAVFIYYAGPPAQRRHFSATITYTDPVTSITLSWEGPLQDCTRRHSVVLASGQCLFVPHVLIAERMRLDFKLVVNDVRRLPRHPAWTNTST